MEAAPLPISRSELSHSVRSTPGQKIFTVQHDEWVTFLSCDQHVLERAGAAAAAGTACRGQYVWLAGAEASEVDDNGFLQLLIACRNQVHRLSG